MEWLLLAAMGLAIVLASRWAASALWVRMISDRWSEFDAADESAGPDRERGRRGRNTQT